MGTVKERLKGCIMTNQAIEYVTMWIGPRTEEEIKKTLAGNPTLVPCAIGPNLRDGDGVHGLKKTKNFMTVEEMENWVEKQKPKQKKYPCPWCEFTGKNGKELSDHMKKDHKTANTVSTPDYSGAKKKESGSVAAREKAKKRARF